MKSLSQGFHVIVQTRRGLYLSWYRSKRWTEWPNLHPSQSRPTMQIWVSHLCSANTERRNNAARCERELHFYCSIAQSAPWIIHESADRRGAGSTRRVPLGRNNSRQSGGPSIWSCGLWILMTVQWSRYATQQSSCSPTSAVKSGCVQTGNLCHGATPHMLFFSDLLFPVLSPRCFLLQFCLLKSLPASLSILPHLVLIHAALRMSISDFPP